MHLRVTEYGSLTNGSRSVFCMRNIFIALIAFAVLFTASVAAQIVTITGQKKVYTRVKPISGYKKTFTIRRPIAKASTPALSRKISAAIDPLAGPLFETGGVTGVFLAEDFVTVIKAADASWDELTPRVLSALQRIFA